MASEKFYLEIVVGAQKAVEGLRRIGSAVSSLAERFRALAGSVFSLRNLIAAVGLGLGMKELLTAGERLWRQQKLFDASLAAAGDRAIWTRREFEKLVASMRGLSRWSLAEWYAAGGVINTLDTLNKNLAPALIRVMADIAERTGSLESAAETLWRLLSGMGEAGESLKRIGVAMDQETLKAAAALKEAGLMAEYQALMLGEIEKRTRGLAAAATSGAGAIGRLRAAVTDLVDQAGKIALEALAPAFGWLEGRLRSLGDQLRGAEATFVVKWRRVILGWLQRGYEAVVNAIRKLGYWIDEYIVKPVKTVYLLLSEFRGLKFSGEAMKPWTWSLGIAWKSGKPPAWPGRGAPPEEYRSERSWAEIVEGWAGGRAPAGAGVPGYEEAKALGAELVAAKLAGQVKAVKEEIKEVKEEAEQAVVGFGERITAEIGTAFAQLGQQLIELWISGEKGFDRMVEAWGKKLMASLVWRALSMLISSWIPGAGPFLGLGTVAGGGLGAPGVPLQVVVHEATPRTWVEVVDGGLGDALRGSTYRRAVGRRLA